MKDKILHFSVCAAIVVALAVFARWVGLGVAASAILGFYAAMLCGFGKEFFDVKRGRDWKYFDWMDILADFVGAAVGFAVAALCIPGPFVFDELLRFAFGCFLLCIWLAVILFSVVQSVIHS